MKKNFTLTALIVIIFSLNTDAQVNYSFSATTATYVPVSGGTIPSLYRRPYDYGSNSPTYDEGIANSVPIGFTFNYNGIDYTTINVCANGFATLGAPFNSDTTVVENFYINTLKLGPLTYVSGTDSTVEFSGNTKPVLAPLWDDLNLQANSNLRYITTGSPGSRVLTFEWANALWQYDATGATLSFELKLYEGTNVIEFCYKDEGGTPSAGASASIGITATNNIGGGFMSLGDTSPEPAVSTTDETSSLHKKPENNQVYRFTPLPCAMPLNLHYDTYDNTSVNFSWDAPAGVSNFEYAVTTSSSDPASGSSTSSTSAVVSSLTPDTKYYIHVRSVCSALSQSVWPVVSFATSKNVSPPPTVAWKKTVGGTGNEGDNFAASIHQTSDGGYVLAGCSNSTDGDVSGNHGNEDYLVVKFNSGGAIEWQKSYGGSLDDIAFSIKQTSDGGYIVAGLTFSNDGDVTGNHGVIDDWIVKLNSTGTVEWQKCLGGSQDDEAYSIEQTPDGGYIIAGVTYSNDGDVTGNHSSDADYWVVKLNNNGSIQWQKCLGGSSTDYAFSVDNATDGGYIVAGLAFSNDGDVSGLHAGLDDYWVVKLDSDGGIQWQKCLGGSNEDRAYTVKQTSDGGYIVAGHTESTDGDITSNHGHADYWIVKLTGSGAIQWQKSFGGSGFDAMSSWYAGNHIEQTSDGGFIITGTTASDDGDVNGNHGGSGDYWALKINSSGDFQWQKCLGGSDLDDAFSIEPTSDKGYIIAGISSSNDGDVSGNHGAPDYWIVKLGPDALLPVTMLTLIGETQGKQNLLHWSTATEQNNTGFELQRSNDGYSFNKIGFVNSKAINGNSSLKLNYDFTDIGFAASTNYYRLKQIDKDGKFSYSNIVVLRDENAITAGLSTIYPNPVKNTLNVKVASLNNEKVTLQLTDLSGRLLQNKVTQVGNGETIVQLDVSHLSAGTYFVKIISGDGKQNTVGKFVKE